MNIHKETSNLLLNEKEYQNMSNAINPFGDGRSSFRFWIYAKEYLNLNETIFNLIYSDSRKNAIKHL